MITVTRKIKLKRGSDRSQQIRVVQEGDETVAAPLPRVPRVSRLVALALHCDELLRAGKIENQSALARLLHVTQPRLTQIMNLTLLAPDIQEALLFVPSAEHGRERIHEKMLRPIVAILDWKTQRAMWTQLKVEVASN